MAEMLRLYGYWRSSAAYRVRIALNLKTLRYEQLPVHLLRDGGQQHREDFKALNPQALVPVLMDGERIFRQSMAIIEYLDEAYPDVGRPLMPSRPRDRARVRALAQVIACDIHPLNNLRVMQYLETHLGASVEAKERWTRYWITLGFEAVETLLAKNLNTGEFADGDDPTIADCVLIPQCYNALRFGIDLGQYPTIQRIYRHAMTWPEFIAARPEQQPDAEN